MSVKDAARRLGISPSLVYALCAAGKIAHERHGLKRGRVVIRDEGLEAYRAACVKEAGPTGSAPPPAFRHVTAG